MRVNGELNDSTLCSVRRHRGRRVPEVEVWCSGRAGREGARIRFRYVGLLTYHVTAFLNHSAADLLDSTKIIPEDIIPVQYIGTLELNRNTDNYFAGRSDPVVLGECDAYP